MKVYELAKELDITPKELISFLRENGYKVSSHMQKLDDDVIDFTNNNFVKANNTTIDDKVVATSENESAKSQPVKIHKTFNPNDEIPLGLYPLTDMI